MENRKDSGRSMMEVLLYIGLVGVMTVGTLRMYGEYNTKIKRTKAIEQLDDIATAGRAIFYGRQSMPTPEMLAKLPEKLAGQNISLKDPWDNAISVSADEKCLEVALGSLSQGDCIGLAMTAKSGCEDATGRRRTSVNGAGQALSPDSEYVGQCIEGKTNTVKFYYNRQ
ncbi:MAG: hypothetical protein LBO78_02080 [Rickettsiales bacterium]|nr:hypothetical protein [Rickettsiales bacterium]